MSNSGQQQPGDKDPKGEPGPRFRRGRNLPLIVLLSVLALIAFSQLDRGGGKLASITYAEFQYLGQSGALADIEILHSADHVEIKGKLDKERLESLVANDESLSDEEKKRLDGREGYRVTGVMRGVVDDPAVVERMKDWVATRDKIDEDVATQLWPTFLFTIAPWILIGAFFWFFVFRPMRQAGGAGGVLSFGRSRARMYTPETANINFSDVAGIQEAKEEVREIIEFLSNPGKFQRLVRLCLKK